MPGNSTLQSIARGFDLLELVARSDGGLSLREFAAALGLKPPTAHNLARTLVARRYLSRGANPVRYTLGPAVRELHATHTVRRGRQATRKTALMLAGRLRECTITFAEFLGNEVSATVRVSPARPGIVEEPGHHAFSPYTSASALLLQAFCSDETRATYQERHPFDEYGAAFWKSRKRFDAALALARRKGAVVLSRGSSDLVRVAVPVFTPQHELAGALGASRALPESSTPGSLADRLLAPLQAAARQLSQGLGGS